MPNIYFEMLEPLMWDAAPKPTPAYSYNKNFWTSLPEVIEDNNHHVKSTVKRCPAIKDALHMGYILYSPTDIHIDATQEDIQIQVGSRLNNHFMANHITGMHGKEQMKNFEAPVGYHKDAIRINTCWSIYTDKGYSIFITRVLNRNDLPIMAIDSIVDSDEYTVRHSVPLWIKQGFKGTIKYGTPLFQVIPFKREEWDMKLIQTQDKIKNDAQDLKIKIVSSHGYDKFFWKKKRFK